MATRPGPFAVGRISPEAQRLMDVTRESSMLGIAQAVPGGNSYDISRAVQKHVESSGYSVR